MATTNASTPRKRPLLIDPGTSHTTSPDPSAYRIYQQNTNNTRNNNNNNNNDPLDSESNLRQPLLANEDPQFGAFPQMVSVQNNQEEEDQEPDGLFRPDNTTPLPNDDDNNNNSEELHLHRHVPWYKNPYQRMAMISNLGTSYNVVNISLVLPILEHMILVHHSQQQQTSTPNENFLLDKQQQHSSTSSAEDSSAVASSLLAGMIVGQVVGGALGDTLGLAGALRGVMMLQIVASLGSAFADVLQDTVFHALFHNHHHDHDDNSSEQQQHNLFWALAAWRFILGVGAGAVYPLAACLSVEGGGNRGVDHHNAASDMALTRVVRTFAVQGIGFWLVPALTLPLLHMPRIPLHVTWRIILAVGCIPGFVLLYLQWQLYSHQGQTESRHHHHHHHRHHHHSNRPHYNHDPLQDDEENEDNAGVQQQQNAGEQAANNDTPYSPPASSRSESQLSSGASRSRDSDQASMNDRELLRADSDGEVGTFLDSSPDLSSEGCYGESEPPAIRQGWWASLWMEDHFCQKVLGTAVTWFLFDVLFYGNTLFQPIVVEAAFGPKEQQDGDAVGERHVLQRTALDSLLLTSIALPGYAVAGLLIGKKTCGLVQSVRYVMLQGFALMSLSYLLIGLFWDELRHFPILLVIIYGFSFFFANYGPNTTTFILPSLVYSAECRSTLNGLSAAAGKLGALTGSVLFAPAAESLGDAAVMLICAMIGFVAFMMTVFFVQIPQPNGASTTTTSVSYSNPPLQNDANDDPEGQTTNPLDAEDPLRQPPVEQGQSLPHEQGSLT